MYNERSVELEKTKLKDFYTKSIKEINIQIKYTDYIIKSLPKDHICILRDAYTQLYLYVKKTEWARNEEREEWQERWTNISMWKPLIYAFDMAIIYIIPSQQHQQHQQRSKSLFG